MYTKLKEIMKEQGVSANKLSFMSRIAASDLHCAMNGKKPMYPNWKKRIAEALDTDVESLFNEEAKGGSYGESADN